jgi:hypothetical protein
MKKECTIFALACAGCEQEGSIPEDEVVWSIYVDTPEDKRRVAGYLLGRQIDAYGGRVKKTLSSSTCPECAAIGHNGGDIEALRERLVRNNTVPEFDPNRWVHQFYRFQDRLSGKPKSIIKGRQALFY